MAVIYKKVCDRCKKESESNTISEYGIKGFNTIDVKISEYKHKKFMICDDCAKKYCLYEEFKENKPCNESIYDKIFDLIAEIVSERIEKNE